MEPYVILAFFKKGGLFMYPILFVFVVGMAITVERWFQLSHIRSVNRKIWNVLDPMLLKGEFDKVRAIINKDKSAISVLKKKCSSSKPTCRNMLARMRTAVPEIVSTSCTGSSLAKFLTRVCI